MIVVVGSTHLHGEGPDARPDGLAARIARSAVQGGAQAELIAKIGDDPAGDALLVAIARSGVGHVAVLRDAVHPTARRPSSDDTPVDDADVSVEWTVSPDQAPALEAADVELALRYLTEYRVVVVVHVRPACIAEAIAAADWAGAHLVVVTRPGDGATSGLPTHAVVIEVADEPDDESAIGVRLGTYAAAIDRGEDFAGAFAALTSESGTP